MSDDRGPRELAVELSGRTGVAVTIEGADGGLVVRWQDGPTTAAMQAYTDRACREQFDDMAGSLTLNRTLGPLPFALAMVRHVRFGQPALGAGSLLALQATLQRENYPERASAADLATARRLIRLGGGDVEQMARLLDRHGLILFTGPDPPNNVVPL